MIPVPEPMSATMVSPFLTTFFSAASKARLRGLSESRLRWYSISNFQLRAVDLVQHDGGGDRNVQGIRLALHRNFYQIGADFDQLVRKPGLFVAHQQHQRRFVFDGAVVV